MGTPHLILYSFLLIAAWLIRRDIAQREGVSTAVWIPTLWVGILASRPLSMWLNWGGSIDTLDGSPLDRLFYLTMIVLALITLARRMPDWGAIVASNWGIFLFYGFLLISVFWANSPIASLKRWIKEYGNILIVVVVLTEANPLLAFRAIFVRCAYVLIPLSMIFLRYFPDLGRRYNMHSGEMEAVGVTTQKNSLGSMLLVCGLVLIWDWIDRSRPGHMRTSILERGWLAALAVAGGWLLYVSDSKTSIGCLLLGACIIATVRLPLLKNRISALGMYVLGAAMAFILLDTQVGILEWIVSLAGRDMTFTGRTDVWRELLKVGTDPLFGTGFMSFWDDLHFRERLPSWVAFSAHNGYIEVYLAGGLVGAGILGIMLLSTGARINRALKTGSEYAVVRFGIFVAVLIANFFESNYACMTPLGFLFLLAAIGQVHHQPIGNVSTAFSGPASANTDFVGADEAESPLGSR